MPGKVLGIDINSDSVTAIQVQGGLRGYYITGCARVMIDEAGGLDGARTDTSASEWAPTRWASRTTFAG